MSTGTQTIGRVIAGLLAAIALPLTTATPAAAKSPRQQPWHLDQIGVPAAHAVTQGEGVLVGMFLPSVDANHPKLAGRVRPGRYVGLNGEIKPRPSVTSPDDVNNDTGLAGLVVASGGDGPVGVAPRAEVQPIDRPVGGERISAALRWLVDEGAKVIDMSGGFRVEADIRGVDGIRYALAKDVVVIIDAYRAGFLPSELTTGVLVVGGVDQEGNRWPRPSSDSRIDLSAPGAMGGLIGLSDAPTGDGQYAPLTSFGDAQACAIVAGVVALIRSHHPELNAASVIDRLLATARDIGPPGKDSEYGAGIVNAAAAVTADRPPVTKNPLGDPGPPDSLLDRLTSPVALIAGAVCCLIVTTLAIALLIFLWARRRR